MYGCWENFGRCMRLESYLVDQYFKTLLEPAPGLLFGVVWFAYQPGAWKHVKARFFELVAPASPLFAVLASWLRRLRPAPDGADAAAQAKPPAPREAPSDSMTSSEAGFDRHDEEGAEAATDTIPSRVGRTVAEVSDEELVHLLSRSGSGAGSGGDDAQSSSSASPSMSSLDVALPGTSPVGRRLSMEIQYEVNVNALLQHSPGRK